MASGTYQARKGRVWFQTHPLTGYDLIQCSGLSDWNKPRGTLTPFREPSSTRLGEEEVVGYQRASPDMASFTIQTRFKESGNWLFSLNCESNVQVMLGDCGDPGDYYGFNAGVAWVQCPPGDLTGDALAIIEGENVPIGMQNPFSAIYGPYLIDFKVGFMSRRDIAETGTITDVVMFEEECIEDCLSEAGKGQYGYAVATGQPGSPVDTSSVWFTDDYADTWALCSEMPFAGGEGISCVVKTGTTLNHRVIVARGTTDAANPAEVAVADATEVGVTDWTTYDVGSTNGEYIMYMSWPLMTSLVAVTNLGNIYRSLDGGLTWTQEYNDATNRQLNDVSMLRSGIGWAAGNEDLLLKTDDYGDSWSAVTGPNDGLLNLNTVHVFPDRKIIVGDSAGVMYGSLDEVARGADSWYTKAVGSVTATNIVRVRGYDTHFVWAIVDLAATPPANGNSRVVRSTDGGASFRIWQLATNINPNDGLEALAVIDQNRVVVAGAPYAGTAFLTRTTTRIDVL